MKHGSLFSGIGGFDLAAEWMGWENMFHCEINEFCQKVLKYHFPKSIGYADIKKTDFTEWNGKVDIISGGFPCQPYSLAGKRKGKEDDRHLWLEMLRAIREIQPSWVVGENVFGLLNWNRGMVFHEVQTDLEAAGFVTFPYVLPACGVNAPHKRERVWIIAHSVSNGNLRSTRENGCKEKEERLQKWNEVSEFNEPNNLRKFSTNTESNGINRAKELENNKGQSGERRRCDANDIGEVSIENWFNDVANTDTQRLRQFSFGEERQDSGYSDWARFPTQSPLCSRNDGLSDRLAGITFSKHRQESIKGYGNAIVPQVAYEIFKAIEQLTYGCGK